MTDKNDSDVEGCCTGPDSGKGSGGVESVTMPPPVPGPRKVADHAVQIPGGRAYVGTGRTEIADDGEGPVRRV